MRTKDAELLKEADKRSNQHYVPLYIFIEDKLNEIEQEFLALQAENQELKSKVKMAEGYFKMREALLEGVEMEALDADIAKAVSINWYDLLMTSDTSEKPTDH